MGEKRQLDYEEERAGGQKSESTEKKKRTNIGGA